MKMEYSHYLNEKVWGPGDTYTVLKAFVTIIDEKEQVNFELETQVMDKGESVVKLLDRIAEVLNQEIDNGN